MGLPKTACVITFIVTKDRKIAKDFYQDVLGFKVSSEDDFALVFDLNGVVLRISTSESHVALPYTVLGWEILDIVAEVKNLREKKVEFIVYDGMGQDQYGIWTPPGGSTKVAWFKDPDGNVLSLTEF